MSRWEEAFHVLEKRTAVPSGAVAILHCLSHCWLECRAVPCDSRASSMEACASAVAHAGVGSLFLEVNTNIMDENSRQSG